MFYNEDRLILTLNFASILASAGFIYSYSKLPKANLAVRMSLILGIINLAFHLSYVFPNIFKDELSQYCTYSLGIRRFQRRLSLLWSSSMPFFIYKYLLNPTNDSNLSFRRNLIFILLISLPLNTLWVILSWDNSLYPLVNSVLFILCLVFAMTYLVKSLLMAKSYSEELVITTKRIFLFPSAVFMALIPHFLFLMYELIVPTDTFGVAWVKNYTKIPISLIGFLTYIVYFYLEKSSPRLKSTRKED